MILKIRRFCNDEIWWILDDIRRISISRTLEFGSDIDSRVESKQFVDEINILDKFAGIDPKESGPFPYVRLICKLSNGSEFSVVFDTVAYLCNDSGKTIEKLTV